MRILTRYLVARFLGLFVAFLLVSVLTIAVVEMMLNLGDMLRGGEGLSAIATYLLLRLPAYYLRDLIPIVAFAAAFFTLGTAARWLELLAAKAGGVSTQRVGAPLLGTALVLAALALLVNETVVLEATRRWNQQDSMSDPIQFRDGSFWYQRGRTIYNIGNADRHSGTLRGVLVLELDERGRLLRSVEADRARVGADGGLVFHAPRVRRFDARDRILAPTVEIHPGDAVLDLGEGSGDALMHADLQTLSLGQLAQVVARERASGLRDAASRALLQERLAEPWTVLLFVLAAIPLGVGVERSQTHGMTLPALIGIAGVAAFFALRSTAEALASSGLLPPTPTPWALLALFAGLGAWRYAEMPA